MSNLSNFLKGFEENKPEIEENKIDEIIEKTVEIDISDHKEVQNVEEKIEKTTQKEKPIKSIKINKKPKINESEFLNKEIFKEKANDDILDILQIAEEKLNNEFSIKDINNVKEQHTKPKIKINKIGKKINKQDDQNQENLFNIKESTNTTPENKVKTNDIKENIQLTDDELFKKSGTPEYKYDDWMNLLNQARESDKRTLTNKKIRQGLFRFNPDDGAFEILPNHDTTNKSSFQLLNESWNLEL